PQSALGSLSSPSLAPFPMPAAYVLVLFLALASLGSRSRSRAIAGDCPLDFSWLNISLASSACANQNERGKCCRY
ncbi:unnamed protein product, partial [Musa banksii]